MAEFLGLLAFASLIAAQFLAVVVAYSQRFENDLPGGRRSATGMKVPVIHHRKLTPIFMPYLLRGRQSSGRDSALHKLIVPPTWELCSHICFKRDVRESHDKARKNT